MPTIYLIPCHLHEGVTEPIPAYVLQAVKQCQVFFVENERTARRYLKSLWREMVIDDYRWYAIGKAEADVLQAFANEMTQASAIGIISEAGCPGVADPGQLLVARAQQAGATVRPLVGPSSILLALMASGLNGQQFAFHGYLPIDAAERRRRLQQLDEAVHKQQQTQLFIETPYRNDQLLKDMLQVCAPGTRLCIAADITAPTEWVVTKTIREWRTAAIPSLHKRPVLFLIG
ncbi:MAG: SAM-dependent methyltransferase [Chitinophagaceae bacterium]|nr:SAM-dependent methyltransferase [Chitinophagaceae bacterium]